MDEEPIATVHPVVAVVKAFSTSTCAPYYPEHGLPQAAQLLARSAGVPAQLKVGSMPLLHYLARHTPSPTDITQSASLANLASLLVGAGADPLSQVPWGNRQQTADAFDLALLSGSLDVLTVLLDTGAVSARDLASRLCPVLSAVSAMPAYVKSVTWLGVLAACRTPNASQALQRLVAAGADPSPRSGQHPLAWAAVPVIQMYRANGWFPHEQAALTALEKSWRRRLMHEGVNQDLVEQVNTLRATPLDAQYDAAVVSLLAAPLGSRFMERRQRCLAKADQEMEKTTTIDAGGFAGKWNTVGTMCCAALRGHSERSLSTLGSPQQSPLVFLKETLPRKLLAKEKLCRQANQLWRPGLPFSGVIALAAAAADYAARPSHSESSLTVSMFMDWPPGQEASPAGFFQAQAPLMCEWLLAMPASSSLAAAGIRALRNAADIVARNAAQYRCLSDYVPMEKLALTVDRLSVALRADDLERARAVSKLLLACLGTPQQASGFAIPATMTGFDLAWHADMLLSEVLAYSPVSSLSAQDVSEKVQALVRHPVWQQSGAPLEKWMQRLHIRVDPPAPSHLQPLLARLQAQHLRIATDAAPPPAMVSPRPGM